MTQLLTINTIVPSSEEPGSPTLVFYENGDWGIEFAKDVGYLEDDPSFLGSVPISLLMMDIDVFFDNEPEDETGFTALLFLSQEIEDGTPEEPVVVIYENGEHDVLERNHAEHLVKQKAAYNFMALPEFFDELRHFVSTKNMFAVVSDEPFEAGDEEQERD